VLGRLEIVHLPLPDSVSGAVWISACPAGLGSHSCSTALRCVMHLRRLVASARLPSNFFKGGGGDTFFFQNPRVRAKAATCTEEGKLSTGVSAQRDLPLARSRRGCRPPLKRSCCLCCRLGSRMSRPLVGLCWPELSAPGVAKLRSVARLSPRVRPRLATEQRHRLSDPCAVHPPA